MPAGPQTGDLRVLMITSEWPTAGSPALVPFIVRSVEFLRRAHVDVDVFHFRGAKQPLNYVRAWAQLHHRIRSKPYHLIHAQFGQSGLLAIPPSLPLVVTFRGSDLEGIIGSNGRNTLAGRALQVASQIVARTADEVIAVSESLAQHLPRRKLHIIPSGIDLNLFRPLDSREARERLNLPTERRLVLFAANPRNFRKRYALAQAVVERLRNNHDVELLVAHGVPHETMPLYMSASDVLLLTSLHEGSPNVVKEALACNLPVVSTDVGDVRARIQGIDGCAIVDDDVEQIAAVLDTLLKRNMRSESRKSVLPLDETLLTEQIIDVYKMAMAKRAAGALRA